MADHKPQGTQAYSVESGYESGDANVKSVVAGLTIILVSTLVVMLAMFGMFRVLNNRVLEQDDKIPVALAQRIIPPEPRLLPEAYSDEAGEADKLGATSEDGYPWDKRNLEIGKQYDEANAVGQTPQKTTRIPIDRAMALQAGVNPDATTDAGTPAIMAWQPEYPALVAGKTDETMNLVAGKKRVDRRIFDDRPYWESKDEKYNSESTGGTDLKISDLGR
jgi:hypothetical protein